MADGLQRMDAWLLLEELFIYCGMFRCTKKVLLMAKHVHDQHSFGMLILSLASAEESTAFKSHLSFLKINLTS